MHSGDMAELGGVNLTDAEREALLEVMQRAKVRFNTVWPDYTRETSLLLWYQDFDDKTQKMNRSALYCIRTCNGWCVLVNVCVCVCVCVVG